MWRDEPLRWRQDRTRIVAVGGLMKSRADWGNRQGNSARCFLYFLNEINSLGRQFGSHQPPQTIGKKPGTQPGFLPSWWGQKFKDGPKAPE